MYVSFNMIGKPKKFRQQIKRIVILRNKRMENMSEKEIIYLLRVLMKRYQSKRNDLVWSLIIDMEK